MQTLTLPDGRQLAYQWFGTTGTGGYGGGREADVPTVLYLHGFASSRLEAGLQHDHALHHGLRILSIDRPGTGRSTFHPSMTVESVAEDVGRLLDHLGLTRVAVMGVSGGSPFACACAARLPRERVAALLLVCPLMPSHGREAQLLQGTSPTTLRLFTGVRSQPWRLWATLHVLRLIQRVPHGSLLLRISGFAPQDLRVVHELPHLQAILSGASREGLTQGVGHAFRELQIYYADPPTIDLSSIPCKAVIWQGGKDTTTPPAMARHYAATIPDATLHLLDDEAHLSLPFRHSRNILGSIVEHATAMQQPAVEDAVPKL